MHVSIKTLPRNAIKSKIGGLVAATLTPFDTEGNVDITRLFAHIRTLFADGCDRIVLFGSTGEGAALAAATKLQVLQSLIDHGVRPSCVILGVMENDPSEARKTIKMAAEHGVHAVLALPPFYYPASDDGIIQFLTQSFGGRDPGIDVILYHIPQLARVGFSHELVFRLRDQFGSRIVGIKDSTGVCAHTLDLVQAFPDLAIFTGTDTDLPPLLDTGGAGIIGGLPNINARGLRQVMDMTGAAREAPSRLASALLQAVEDNGGISALKAIVARRYQDDAWLRMLPPLMPLKSEAQSALLARVETLGYKFEIDSSSPT